MVGLVALALVQYEGGPRRTIRLNDGWMFHVEGPNAPRVVPEKPYEGKDWTAVQLPHSARLEDDTAPKFESFQGVVWYHRTIPKVSYLTSNDSSKILTFEGAMQAADIWVNGKHRQRHVGGYLPFDVQLDFEFRDRDHVDVDVRLDNRDDPTFPPGRPQKSLDFLYSGGLYRNVWLTVAPAVHITRVRTIAHHVSAAKATIWIKPGCLYAPGTPIDIQTRIIDPNGRTVAVTTFQKQEVEIEHPMLWDLDHPNLYTAVSVYRIGNREIDRVSSRFGIRNLTFNHKKGVFLNGKPIRLEGSNRHMGFPIVGNAASDEAQYREAKRLKSYGLNILRLAHYPQSPAFLAACDQVGILVIDPIPGWQFFRNDPGFKANVLSDVIETVRRDRNHPSVAIFETCLNETYNAPDSFWRECVAAAKKEIDRANIFTGGDAYGKQDFSKPLWDVPWTGWDDASVTRPALYKMQKGIDREYGDYEFGGEQSTSRAGRGDGEGALMLQAWNFIWSHNRNRGNPWSFGDLTWEAIDTYRGMNPASPVSKSGMLDLFRLPKPVAFFYRSQGAKEPMVHIANAWTARPSPTKVVVFSNADEVELRLNGRSIARRKPDNGPTTGYIGPKIADPLYWAKGDGTIKPATSTNKVVGGTVGAEPFSGGNARNLSHPPFTFFGVPFERGELEAIGYHGGKIVARDVVRTPGVAKSLSIRIDTEGVPLRGDGADFVFVYVDVRDKNGQIVPDAHKIHLDCFGAAEVLGASTRGSAAGTAAFMVRSRRGAGKFELKATSPALISGVATGRTN